MFFKRLFNGRSKDPMPRSGKPSNQQIKELLAWGEQFKKHGSAWETEIARLCDIDPVIKPIFRKLWLRLPPAFGGLCAQDFLLLSESEAVTFLDFIHRTNQRECQHEQK